MSEDHSADRARLLALLPAGGSAIGNIALMRSLKWSEHRYWYARDSLLEEGAIARARGRGGAVRRVLLEQGGAAEAANEATLAGERTLAYVHEPSFTRRYSTCSRRPGRRNARSSHSPLR